MELNDIRVFLAVAEASSVNRAAPHLGRVSSNVSMRISQLERRLGVTLFTRSSTGMTLTREGESLRTHAYALIRGYEEALGAVGRSASPSMVRIGVVSDVCSPQISSALASYVALHPSTDVHLEAGSSRELCARVATGELDGAFCDAEPSIEGVRFHPLYREVLIMAGSRTWRGEPHRRAISFGSESTCHKRLVAWYESQSAAPMVYIQSPSIEFAVSSMAAGAAIGVLPVAAFERYDCAHHMTARPLPAPLDSLQISFAFRANGRSRSLTTLLDMVEAPLSEQDFNSDEKRSSTSNLEVI